MMLVVVDDNKDMGEIIAHMLDQHDVHYFSSAEEAMRFEGWPSTDAAFVDLMMPQIDGVTFLAWLAAHHPNVRRIPTTAAASLLDDALPYADAVVVKPFSYLSLKRALGAADDVY